MALISSSVEEAAQHLINEEVIGIPTETVYGLAGNALNESAVIKIFEVKNRPRFDPLIVHVNNLDQADHLVKEVPPDAWKLAERFWPGPLTLLFEKTSMVPDLLTSGSSRVAIRIPNHKLTLQLLESVDFPLAAPSANPFGYVSPTTPEHVQDQLGNKIPFILDGGPCEVGLESTIIGFEDGQPVVYRLGGIAIEDVEAVVGRTKLNLNLSSNPQAPGMLKSHYAPSKKIVIGDIPKLAETYPSSRLGIISFSTEYGNLKPAYQEILAPGGNLQIAAKALFGALRRLDKSDAEVILSEPFPDKGLGRAINDRLKRAST